MLDQEVRNYLNRIDYHGDTSPTLQNLCALQRAHQMHVPYENLDIFYRQSFSLSHEEIYDKIVTRHRGGYCFELNGLWAWLLRSLGYRIEEYLGRWIFGDTIEVPMRRHRIVKVFLPEGEFITDVGVGQSAPLSPYACVLTKEQELNGQIYRVIADPRQGKIIQRRMADGTFTHYFSFDECPQHPVDFIYPHYYWSNHPQSIFLRKLMVFLPTSCGRNSISSVYHPEAGTDMPVLKCSQPDGSEIQKFLPSKHYITQALHDYFGIDYNLQ